MSKPLFGHLLARRLGLSDLDVEEILQEQKATSRRFGEAAISLGLASSGDVLRAWADQLAEAAQHVDLNRTGVDVQAVGLLPAQVARQAGVLPLRATEHVLIVACDRPLEADTLDLLARVAGRSPRVVLTDAKPLREQIDRYYPPRDGRANAAA